MVHDTTFVDKYTLAHDWLRQERQSPARFDNPQVVISSSTSLCSIQTLLEPVMFLDSNSFISRASRKLWLLPTFVIPTALGSCFVVSELFGSNLTELVVTLVIIQVISSVILWKGWRGTQEQFAGVRHELSSLQSIVDVSRDAI